MIIRALTTLFGLSRPLGRQETTLSAPVVIEKAKRSDKSGTNKYDTDVKALSNKWGELEDGLCIETTLQELLVIAPRRRHRADAYIGLASFLREKYGVSLIIKSRKTR